MEQEIRFGLSPKALISDGGGRYLAVLRSRESAFWPGVWDLPGGKPDAGETFAEALVREAREETGLEVAPLGLVGAAEFDLPHIRIVFLVMRCVVVGGAERLSDEHEEFRWVTAEELRLLCFVDPIAKVLSGFTG